MKTTFFVGATLIACFVGSGAWAAPFERAWSRTDAQGKTFYLLEYAENSVWKVDEYSVLPGKLQDREWQRLFSSRDDADDLISSMLEQGFAPYRIPSVQSQKLQTELDDAVIWRATQSWNTDWEKKYALWVTANVDVYFYQKYQIPTDCADVAFSLRWIFARINHLPAANTLAATGTLFTNESMKSAWKKLPTAANWYEDKLFLTALEYVMVNTYTHTLHADSYPIKIDLENVTAGVHHLEMRDTDGHTMMMRSVDANSLEILDLLYSDDPRVVRKLYESGYWYRDQPAPDWGGFLRMRWPIKQGSNWMLTSKGKMPGYSEEQYTPEFMGDDDDFSNAVLRHLVAKIDVVSRFKDGIAFLELELNTRKDIVEQGFAFCQKEDCSPGTQNYDNWSTPARDSEIVDMVMQLRDTLIMHRSDYPEVLQIWSDAEAQTMFTIEGQTLTLQDLVVRSGSFSFDPRDSIAVRWAID